MPAIGRIKSTLQRFRDGLAGAARRDRFSMDVPLLVVCGLLVWSAHPAMRDQREAQATVAQQGVGSPWVGKTTEIESQLRAAEIVSLEDVGAGVTRPRRAHLRPSSPVESLAWKVLPPGRRRGYWESYKSEIAAYELDKLLGMNMVPPAVERTIDGEIGAAVMWVEGLRSVKELGGKVPAGPSWSKPLRKMLMFDNLTRNIDRNAGNILIGRPGELILIDHSRAFTSDTGLVNKVERVDAELWDRMKALTREDVDRTVGQWIDREQVAAMIGRRDAMVKAVDKLVAQKGRPLVIIP